MAEPGRHWFLNTIGGPRAWQIVFGGPLVDLKSPKWEQIERFGWAGVRIGHLDHGYTRHPATAGSVQPQLGVNYMEPATKDPRDPMTYSELLGRHGHGCRTGSVLAGCDKAEGYLGVAPRVPLIPYRVTNRSVMNAPGGTLDEPEAGHVAKAIRHAIHDNGCPVLSISLGSLLGWKAMGEAVDEAYELGVIIVAAAGQVVGKVVYPGKYPQVIRVGGIEPGNRPYFTYDGLAQPDIWAPGRAVWRAAAALPDDGRTRYGYDLGEGTSFSTAVIAGLAALFVRRFRAEMDARGYKGWQRVELFRALLPRGGKSVVGVKGGAVVQLPGVLAALPASWPKPSELRRAAPKAAEMQQ